MAVLLLADELSLYLLHPEPLRTSLWKAATKEGAAKTGKVTATELPSVDLVVCGSAVRADGISI
jgi:hypothetical protein